MRTPDSEREEGERFRAPTVLLVEDDPAEQILVQETLRPHGVIVDAVTTMFDALELLALQPGSFDVVVADLGLPDIGGLESLDTLLGSVSLPVVIRSGNGDPALPPSARRLGAAGFVHKDEPRDVLVAVVKDNLPGSFDLARVARTVADRVGGGARQQSDFTAAVRATLDFLNAQLPLGTWMVTRVDGDDWIILDAIGDAYGVEPGDVLRWSDSFCSRMARGEGPSLTAAASSVPAYAEAPIGRELDIETYVGLPLVVEGGGLFGTLCGIDPTPTDAPLADLEPFLAHTARMLSTALSIDLERDRLQRRLDLAKAASRTDPLTGLPNRRAFELMLRVEEVRARRYGAPAAVAVIDLDNLKLLNDRDGHEAGDRYLRAAAQALAGAMRSTDTVFRIGGDEFAVIAAPCPAARAKSLATRLRTALAEADVTASLGVAVRGPHMTMHEVVDQADGLMYAEKTDRAG